MLLDWGISLVNVMLSAMVTNCAGLSRRRGFLSASVCCFYVRLLVCLELPIFTVYTLPSPNQYTTALARTAVPVESIEKGVLNLVVVNVQEKVMVEAIFCQKFGF